MSIYPKNNCLLLKDSSETASAKQSLAPKTIKFIEIVQNRPEIWDSTNYSYKQKEIKLLAWKSIASDMDPNFFNLGPAEQNLAVIAHMRRWKSLRDCYRREGGRNVGKKRKYIYYDHLTFLDELPSKRKDHCTRIREYGCTMSSSKHGSYSTEDNLWSDQHVFLMHQQDDTPKETYIDEMVCIRNHNTVKEEIDDEDEDEEMPQPVAVFSLHNEDPLNPSLENSIDKNNDNRTNFCKGASDDEDRIYLLSLLPDIKKVAPHMKSQVKSKIQSIIQEAMIIEIKET